MSSKSGFRGPCDKEDGKRAINCWNLIDSNFFVFFDPHEANSAWKGVFEWQAESLDCLLIHWLPISSILFLIETIYSNVFRSTSLRNQKYLLVFFIFCKFILKFEHFQKKITFIGYVFLNLPTLKLRNV